MALSTLVQDFNTTFVTDGATNESVVIAMFANIYGTAEADIPAGFKDWWVAQLESGAVTQATIVETSLGFVAAGTLAQGDLTTAATAAKAAIDAGEETVAGLKVAVEAAIAETPDTETPDTETPDTGAGDTFTLTSSTDRLTGTSGDDVFTANIQQNPWAGGVSNSLSSADTLKGGAGNDTLNAELIPEFFGVTGDNQIDVQPRTESIEEVYFEARDNGSNDVDNLLVTVDAKNMTDITKIGSTFSDADLVIENLTTLTSAGEIRNTEAITVVMDHTDNFNSDGDASDLTVYFDEDYLVSGESTSGSSLTINMINTLNNKLAEGGGTGSLIEGFETVSFTVGETLITVDVQGLQLSEVKAAIEAALTEAGITTVSVETYQEPAFFATTIYYEDTGTTYQAGTSAGADYTAFRLTNTGSEELVEGGFTLANDARDGSLAYSQDDRESVTNQNPVTINVELEKVGRDGEGGNLIIGGKDQNSQDDSDKDQQDGIDVFNVAVRGNDDQPNNLGVIRSTNNQLNTINITDHATWDGADLTVRDLIGGGQELTLIDASQFSGDFSLAMSGSDAQQAITSKFGIGNDSYDWESVEADGVASGKDYSISMGAGDDTVTASLDGNSVDAEGESFTLTTGNGNDTVTLTGAQNVSDATTLKLDNVNVDLGANDDKLNLNTEIITKVNAGSGSDFVVVDANNSGLNGTTGEWTLGTGSDSTDGSWNARVLYEATVTVNFAGFEQTLEIPTTAANNFVATQADINAAVIAAIAANPELTRLLTTEVNNGSEDSQLLTITSTVQGLNDLTISINQPVVVAAATAVAGDVTITSSEYAALEAGLLATGAVVDSAVIGTVTPEADLISVLNAIDGNLDEEGNVATDLVLDSADGSDNTNATSRAIINMGTGANDLVVLDSDRDSSDTLVFSANWDKVSVVNFDAQSTAVGSQNEVQTISVAGVSAGEDANNGNLTITLGNGDVVTVIINANDDSQTISDAIVAAVNGSALGLAGDVLADNAGGTTITLTYDSSLGNVATTTVAELIATDATMSEAAGAAATAEVTAEAEVTNVTFANAAADTQTIIFDGTTITLADTDGSGAVEVDEIAQQVAAGTYANFTVTDYDYSAGVVQFTANTAGIDQSVVSGLLAGDMGAGDFTGTAITVGTTTATPGFAAVGTTVTAGQDGVDAAAAIAEGDDVLTFTAADEAGTLSLFVDHDGDATTDALQVDVALLATDSAISVATKSAAALTAALDAANWTVTDNGDGTVTLAKSAALGDVESTTFVDGAVDTAIADATTTAQGQTGSGVAATGDILDFTAWLNDKTSTSGSTESGVVTAVSTSVVSATGDLNLGSNEVVIINDFAQDTSGTLNETWALLDADDIDAALEGSTAAYGNFVNGGSTAVADPATLLGTGISSILMVENDQNAGEYKVFSVETNAAAADGSEFTVELLGVIDFGAEQASLTAVNFGTMVA